MKTLLDHFRTAFGDDTPERAHTEEDVQLAAAVLIVEMSRADHEVGAEEREAVRRAVAANFGLDEADTEAMVRAAEAEADAAVSLHRFTTRINEHWSQEDKQRLIETLWGIAYSDTEMHALEEHLVRKLAGLLYVPHRAFIRARHRARSRSGD